MNGTEYIPTGDWTFLTMDSNGVRSVQITFGSQRFILSPEAARRLGADLLEKAGAAKELTFLHQHPAVTV